VRLTAKAAGEIVNAPIAGVLYVIAVRQRGRLGRGRVMKLQIVESWQRRVERTGEAGDQVPPVLYMPALEIPY